MAFGKVHGHHLFMEVAGVEESVEMFIYAVVNGGSCLELLRVSNHLEMFMSVSNIVPFTSFQLGHPPSNTSNRAVYSRS